MVATGPLGLEGILERIVHDCSPDRVLLFGSYAKGTQTSSSDVDLLVICDTGLEFGQRERRLRQLFASSALSVDIVMYTPEEIDEALAEQYSWLRSVVRCAVVLYESERTLPPSLDRRLNELVGQGLERRVEPYQDTVTDCAANEQIYRWIRGG